MAVILLDMDDVLADFEGKFLERWRERHPDLPFIPRDQRNIFKLERQYPAEHLDKVRAVIREPGFFLALDPIPGGLEAVREMVAQHHEVFFCTAPITDCPTCPTEKFQWIVKHLGQAFVRRIILTSDKTLVRGDLLVDDNPLITGVTVPEWEHVVFDFPYNRHVQGKRRLVGWNDWRDVLRLW
jgi:5'-nucleotidase